MMSVSSQSQIRHVCLPHKVAQINYKTNKTSASHLTFLHNVSSHNDLDFSLGLEGVGASAWSQGEYCTGTPPCLDQDGAGSGWTRKKTWSVFASGHILNGRLFAVLSVDAELRPSCRVDNANKSISSPLRDIVHYAPPRFDFSCPSSTSLPVSATTPNILITTEVSPIIIAHLPHTISGSDTRKPQNVGVAKKKCIQILVRPF